MTTLSLTEVDFHDSDVVGFHYKNGTVTLQIVQWNARALDIAFEGVVYVRAYVLEDVVEAHYHHASHELEDARKALAALGEDLGDYEDLQHLQLWDDGPVFDVIFQRATVTVTRRSSLMTRPDPTRETIRILCAELSLPEPNPYSQDWVAELPEHYRSADWIRRYIAKAAERSLDRASQLVLLDLCLDSINNMWHIHEPEAIIL